MWTGTCATRRDRTRATGVPTRVVQIAKRLSQKKNVLTSVQLRASHHMFPHHMYVNCIPVDDVSKRRFRFDCKIVYTLKSTYTTILRVASLSR